MAIGLVGNITSHKQVEEPWMFRKERKYHCKQEVGSFDTALWQMTPIRAAFVCSKACDIVAEDFSGPSQHSSAWFLRSAGSAWQELEGWYSWISELRLEDLKRVTFYCWTLQEDPTSRKALFSWTFLELLAYLVMLTSSELLSCAQGAVPVRSPRLLDRVLVLIHLLNEKSPHHARKRKESGKLPY